MKTLENENKSKSVFRVAAIDVNDPDKVAHVLEFSSREEAARQLNAMNNEPGCPWTAADENCEIQVGEPSNESIMGTRVKAEHLDKQHRICGYLAKHLENGEYLEAMVQEAQAQLLPCAHCGYPSPVIIHYFQPIDQPCPENPHMLVASCRKGYNQEPVGHCGCESKRWYAEDTEKDFRVALRLIVEGWNRRPNT